jgi:hypothetical protein
VGRATDLAITDLPVVAPLIGLRRFLAVTAATVLMLAAVTPDPRTASGAVAARNDPIGSVVKQRRTGPQPPPATEETPPRAPDEAGETRFTTSRIVTAVVLQALLLALIAGLILYRRSARRREHPVVLERHSGRYLCLSLTDGRRFEGSLRGREANGHVLVLDVDHVIDPDGTRRGGTAEDSFVPVSTVDNERCIERPRSA